MNIPNALTILRILLVPLFIIFLIQNDTYMALSIFVLAGITDGLDGFLARILNQRTLIGAYLDPIADKFLLISAYLTLTIKDMLPAWLTVLVISRDVIILSGIVILSLMRKEVKIRPFFISKINTVVQVATIVIVLLFATNYKVLLEFFIVATALFTVLSGFSYIYSGIKIMGDDN